MFIILRRIVVLAAVYSLLLFPSPKHGVSGSSVKAQSNDEPVWQCPIEDQRRCQELGGTMNPRTCVCE